MIESNFNNKKYDNDNIRILNSKQAAFYWSKGVEPLDIYPSESFETKEPVMVFVFSRSQTQETGIYDEWCTRKKNPGRPFCRRRSSSSMARSMGLILCSRIFCATFLAAHQTNAITAMIDNKTNADCLTSFQESGGKSFSGSTSMPPVTDSRAAGLPK